MTACPRIGKLIGGCKFEAQYNEGEPAMSLNFQGSASPADCERVIRATKSKTFAGALCLTCGKMMKLETVK